MLLNLSHHPISTWSVEQRAEAERLFKTVVDVPAPVIDPHATLPDVQKTAIIYARKCNTLCDKHISAFPGEFVAVHVMGEETFTYNVVRELEQLGILCVASTSERNVVEGTAGSETINFRFVDFCPYFPLRNAIDNMMTRLNARIDEMEKRK